MKHRLFTLGLFAAALLGTTVLPAIAQGQSTNRTAPRKESGSRRAFLMKAFKGRAREVNRSVVRLLAGGKPLGYALAVRYERKKYILGVAHVMERARDITCRNIESLEFELKPLARDFIEDLVLYDIVDLGDRRLDAWEVRAPKDLPVVGSWALVCGQSATPLAVGVVGAVNRNVDDMVSLPENLSGLPGLLQRGLLRERRPRSFVGVIQHDAPLSDRMIGTPLMDATGKTLLGLNAFRVSRGTGYAVPVGAIAASLSTLAAGTNINVENKPVLGVTIRNLRQGDRGRVRAVHPGGGAFVERVSSGSAADRGGIRVGDIVIRINEREVYTAAQVVDTVRKADPGKPVRVYVIRGTQPLVEPLTFQPDGARK